MNIYLIIAFVPPFIIDIATYILSRRNFNEGTHFLGSRLAGIYLLFVGAFCSAKFINVFFQKYGENRQSALIVVTFYLVLFTLIFFTRYLEKKFANNKNLK